LRTLEIRSSGRLENTTVHLNGEQIVGVRELFLNLKEDGTFDNWITYESTSNEILSKELFREYLADLNVNAEGFAAAGASLVFESDGNIDGTTIWRNEQRLDGLVEIFVYLRNVKTGWFKWRRDGQEDEFRAEAQFRNQDGSINGETIF